MTFSRSLAPSLVVIIGRAVLARPHSSLREVSDVHETASIVSLFRLQALS